MGERSKKRGTDFILGAAGYSGNLAKCPPDFLIAKGKEKAGRWDLRTNQQSAVSSSKKRRGGEINIGVISNIHRKHGLCRGFLFKNAALCQSSKKKKEERPTHSPD